MKRKDIRKLDNEFRKLVRTGKSCLKCGATEKVQASHVIPVSTCGYILRWSFLNCIPLCYRCHFFWWHKNPIEALEWFKDMFGNRRIKKLSELRLESWKYITPEEVRVSWKKRRD